jgi:hypothetical protein
MEELPLMLIKIDEKKNQCNEKKKRQMQQKQEGNLEHA